MMAPRSSLHSVGFEPRTLRSILKVSGCPTIEPTPGVRASMAIEQHKTMVACYQCFMIYSSKK
jgi:hypothetical protein